MSDQYDEILQLIESVINERDPEGKVKYVQRARNTALRIRSKYKNKTPPLSPERINQVMTNISNLEFLHSRISTKAKNQLVIKQVNEQKEKIFRAIELLRKLYNIAPPHWLDRKPDTRLALPGGGGGNYIPYVLEIAHMPAGLDLTEINSLLTQYMSHSRLNFYKDSKRSLYVEDEYSEWITEKSSNGRQVGKGHFAMDVKTNVVGGGGGGPPSDGIDVFCVIMGKTESYEKSLAQKFVKGGAALDTMFKEKKFDDAVKLFMESYISKLNDVKVLNTDGKQMANLYYLGFVSTTDKIFLVNFKINLQNIQYVNAKYTTKTGQSIFLTNFIDERYGNVKLYKAKKRIEFRMKRAVLPDPGAQIIKWNAYGGQQTAVCVYELPPDIAKLTGEGDLEAELAGLDEDDLKARGDDAESLAPGSYQLKVEADEAIIQLPEVEEEGFGVEAHEEGVLEEGRARILACEAILHERNLEIDRLKAQLDACLAKLPKAYVPYVLEEGNNKASGNKGKK
jgi:hypothetical protein